MQKVQADTQVGIEMNASFSADEYKRVGQKLAHGKKYGLRTEFRRDCELIVAVLSPWLLSWKEAAAWMRDDSHVDPDGKVWSSQNWTCDTVVQFVIAKGGPKLSELQWLINAIVDCHVAAQTVAPLEAYTGERLHYETFDEVATPPRGPMLKKAIKALKEAQDTCALFSEIHQEAIEKCRAVMGDEEAYKRRIAKRSAAGLVRCWGDPSMDIETLETALYANMTFDKAGAHINLPFGTEAVTD